MKKKVLKVLIGEAYDKDAGKNYPVYASYWEQKDGTFSRTEKLFVNEIEVADEEKPKPKPTL